MIKKFYVILLIICLSLLGLAKLRIVTSINIISDWLNEIGKDKVEVHTLITGLETPHTYSPRPSDALALNRADGFIGIGLGLESWLQSLVVSSSKKSLPIFYLSDNLEEIEESEHDHGHSHEGNPHVWLSLENAQKMVNHISQILSSLDQTNTAFYNENAKTYIQSLKILQDEYKAKFATISDPILVSFPATYPYLFKEMGIIEAARGEEVHGQEPSARRMITLANLMKKSNIKVLISEKQFFSPLPESLAKETGAKIVYLSPLLLNNQSFLDMMKLNYNALYEALAN